jgi:transporter family-2 protein
MYPALLAFALCAGCLLAVQASANQQLNRAVGTPYGASTVQLTAAAVALALLALATGSIGAVALIPGVEPWWLLLAGTASPLYITAGILLFPRLGALVAVGLFVTGQVFASIVLDLTGLLGVPRQPPGVGIALGALAVLVGVTVVVRSQLGTPPTATSGTATSGTATSGTATSGTATSGPASTPAPRSGGGAAPGTVTAAVPRAPTAAHRSARQAGRVVLGLLAGAVLPVQGAVNGRLEEAVGAPLAVGTISFVVATLTISCVLVVLVALRRTPAPRFRPLARMPWWGWLGGFCAATYVTATFLLIPALGAAVTVALTVTGQQLASALIDHRGWFRMPRRPLTAVRLGGLGLLVAGSVLAQLS